MTDFAAVRRMMVDCQVRTNDVTDPRILAALLELPRERFAPQAGQKAPSLYMPWCSFVAPGHASRPNHFTGLPWWAKQATWGSSALSTRVVEG